MRLIIHGAPRTKKTSNRVLRFGAINRIVPSAQYLAWRDAVVPQLLEQWMAHAARIPCEACTGAGVVVVGKKRPQRKACPRCARGGMQGEPLRADVHLAATFHREAATGDLIGYMQGLADALEEAGVLANDRLIVSWDGTRMTKDKARPRIELTITALAIAPVHAAEPEQRGAA